MKQYLKRLLDAKKTTVIELNRYRYVEIAHERPTPIFLSEEMWLNYVEPFKKDKGMQETQLGSMLNEFDFAAFQCQLNTNDSALYFHAHLLEPFSSEMSFVAMKADVWKYKRRKSAVFLEAVTSYTTWNCGGDCCESKGSE